MSAFGLTLLIFAGETAGAAAPAARPQPTAAAPADPCQNRQERQGDIIICAERQSGYRLNPDLQEAKRELKRRRLKRPENFAHNDCATVGPMGCRGGPYINLLAAAATAAEMANRVAEGKEIGSMFKTTPEPTEYQLYLEAKHRREAKEAAAAAKAKAPPIEPASPPIPQSTQNPPTAESSRE
jgi:hypothetical protein